MAVLFLGHDASRTGAPLLLLSFLKWLRQHSTMEFELLLKNGGDLVEEYSRVCPTRCLVDDARNAPKSKGLALALRAARKLGFGRAFGILQNTLYPVAQFPAIYANTIATCDLALKFARPGRRIIHHIHELSYSAECLHAVDALREMANDSFAFIAASNAVRDYLEKTIGIPAGKVQVIHEFPIATGKDDNRNERRKDVLRRLGIGEDAFVVGMCGSAEWRKGTDLFVQLAMHVKGLVRPARCHFVWLGGNTNTHREALHDVAMAGLSDICHFIPSVPDPEIYFSAFDLFALTSRQEAFSLAMLEAASNALAILCFAGSGGASELVEDNAGIIVPYLDVAAMAKACAELLADDARRHRLGQNARAKVEKRYALAIQGPKLLAILRSALGENQ